jgi:circadian clock protein KaiB
VKRRARTWKFQLYVAGESPRSRAARENLERICRASLGNNYAIEVLDLLQHPELWREHQVLATPTAVRRSPEPERRVIGDLSVTDQVLKGLDIPGPTGEPGRQAVPEAGTSTGQGNPEPQHG